MRTIFYQPEQQQQFIEKGYVTMPLLSAEEVAMILNELQDMRPHDGFAPVGLRSDYHCTFLDTNEDYKRRAYELINSVFIPHLEKVLHQYRIITGNFYIKQPGKGKFEIHQNWMHAPEEKYSTVTIWCPLQDVDRRNGTLEIVPGSHKIVPDVATVNVDYYFKPFEEVLEEKYLQPIVLKAGECMIFDDTLIHYSGQNTSDKPRIAIQIEAIPNEMTPVFYHFDKDNPEKGFEVFEVDANFFMKGNLTNMHQRPERLRSLGFTPNINRPLSESEFLEKMKTGPITREAIYAQV